MNEEDLPSTVAFPPRLGSVVLKIGPFNLNQAVMLFVGAGIGGGLAMVVQMIFPQSTLATIVSFVLFALSLATSLALALLKTDGLPLWRYQLLKWRFSRRKNHLEGKEAAEFVPIQGTTEDTLSLPGDVFVRGIELKGVNMGLLTEQGRRDHMAAFLAILHSVDFPVQVIARPFPFETAPSIRLLGDREESEKSAIVKEQIQDYAIFLSETTKDTLLRRFFVFTSVSLPSQNPDLYRSGRTPSWEEKVRTAGEVLGRRIDNLMDDFTNAGLDTTAVSGGELVALLKDYLRWEKKDFAPKNFKERVAPPRVHSEKDHIVIGGEYTRVLRVEGYPASLPPGFLSSILSLQEKVDVILHVHPVSQVAALEILAKETSTLKVEHIARTKKGRSDLTEIEHNLEYFEGLREALVRQEDSLYQTSLLVTVRAQSWPELESLTATVSASLRSLMIRFSVPLFRSAEAYRTIMPLCKNVVGDEYLVPGSCIAAMYPFTTSVLVQGGGVLYGLNESNGTPIIFDRYSMENYNSCILGTSGSGKSYMAKLEILRHVMSVGGLRVFIIDPLGEFGDLTEALDGATLRIGPGEDTALNPLWAGKDRTERLRTAMDFLTSLLEMNQEETAIVDYALHTLSSERSDEYVLEDLLAKLRSLQNPAAVRLATLLDRTVSGSLGWLNRRTSVDLASRVVCFNIQGLARELFAPVMNLVLSYITRECARDMEKKLVVVDEAWYLMDSEVTAKALSNATRHFRHYHTGVTLISQTAEDFLRSDTGRVVLANTSIIALVRHKNVSPEMREFFSLTPAEASFVKNARTGKDVGYSTALLVTGNAHTPVRVVSSSFEHSVVTTNPEELLHRQRFGEIEVTQ